MANVTDRLVPVTAAIGVVSTVVCCLPIPFAAAIGAAGLSAAVAPFRSWLIGLSIVLLGAGFLQVYRQPGVCRPRNTATVAVLWISAILVVVVIGFSQLLSAVFADWLG